MAGVCTHYGDRANVGIMQFCCDSIDEVQDLPTTSEFGKGVFENYRQCAPMGSTCTVGNNGDTKVFMLFSNGWFEL